MYDINTWGKTTWIFFHTIAEKIKPEYFNQEVKTLIDIVIKVCSNLPCPECSNDATEKLKKININNIKTKKDFISFLYYFHNNINNKLKKPNFDENKLNIYQNCNLKIVLHNMYLIYNKNIPSPHMMTKNFHKKNMIKSIIIYFNNNSYKFS